MCYTNVWVLYWIVSFKFINRSVSFARILVNSILGYILSTTHSKHLPIEESLVEWASLLLGGNGVG